MGRRHPVDLAAVKGSPVVLVASTGGHLAQAVRWADRLGVGADSTFVTFRSPQSDSLMVGRRVAYVPYVPPRGYGALLRAVVQCLGLREMRSGSCILTTGAGLALACILPALLFRKPLVFIESVSRFDGPSLTGRFMARVPWAATYTQHEAWADRTWWYAGSLLDEYVAVPPIDGEDAPPVRVFVSLGTIKPYRFDALVDAVTAVLRPGDEVTWQLGVTTRSTLAGTAVAEMTAEAFDAECRAADVVICHAGVGTILRLLELGVRPIVVPRSAERGEHVDDHQHQVARALHDRGLVIALQPDQIERTTLTARPGTVKRLTALAHEGPDRPAYG